MSTAPQRRFTVAEYLEIERTAHTKSEFYRGEMFARAGATRRHNLIVANVVGELCNQLQGKPCEVYPGDMKVQIAKNGLFTYPDVVVVCGPPKFFDDVEDVLLNPTLLVEVLSELDLFLRSRLQVGQLPQAALAGRIPAHRAENAARRTLPAFR